MFAYLSQSADGVGGFAIVTDRFVCLLGSSATATQASELYTALDSDFVHLDDALATMVAHYSLSDFAIVQVLDARARRMTVAVQGDVVADVEGATGTRLSGPKGATWFLGEVQGVTALSLSLSGEPVGGTEQGLPLRRGVVRAGSVALNHGDGATSALAFIDEPSPKTVQIDLPRNADPSVAPSRPNAMRVDLAAETAGRRLGVQLSDGNPFAANIPLVFGRRPWSTELDTSSVVSVALESPNREISGIHLEISEVDGSLRARDLHSTNGTVVTSPGRPSWLLSRGGHTVLGVGDVLDLGEGALVRIVAL